MATNETVVLFGSTEDPAVQQSARRLRDAGRCVVIQPAPDHCALKPCTCTTPCREFKHAHYEMRNEK